MLRLSSTSIVLLLCAVAPQSALCDGPQNVVIIVADDVGRGDIGCYGFETVDTPSIDRLASDGLLMRHALSARVSAEVWEKRSAD